MAASDWKGAIAVLKSAAMRDTRNADIQNYNGYSYRRLREHELAFAHFRQALTLNPRHRAAHQHMGETYLTISNIAAAKKHLAALEGICLIACAEYGDCKATTKLILRQPLISAGGPRGAIRVAANQRLTSACRPFVTSIFSSVELFARKQANPLQCRKCSSASQGC
jgi:hypothetical protein